MTAKYNAAAIEILSGLEPVKKRPGMYTDTSDPNHLAQEVIDNSVDEVLSKYASEIEVILHQDGSLSVIDNGRGMPVDLHPERKQSGVEVILTTLHAGGKFSQKNYRYSGGLHGVGVSVVNALSAQLEVWIKRGGKKYYMAFKNGEPQSKLKELGKVGQRNTGTEIRFSPNGKYIDNLKFDEKRLERQLKAKAVLCPGLKIAYSNEATQREKQWCYESGLGSYFQEILADTELLLNAHFSDSVKAKDYEVDWCLNWLTDNTTVFAESYANLVPTPQGGNHVSGMRNGLVIAMREFMQLRKLLPKNVRITPDDIATDLCYLLSVKTINPEFAGQAKERLTSRDITAIVQNVIGDAFALWLNRYPQQGEILAAHIIENARRRGNKAKKVIRKSTLNGLTLPSKLSDCVSNDVTETELFLVEGDSAGGSAKQARNRNFQAILPLRGKIMNTWEVAHDEILKSEELRNISLALGIEPNSTDLRNLRYGKICILADADCDGLHIAVLLATLFKRHFPVLVNANHVYMVVPPLFRIDAGSEVYYVADEKERDKCLKDLSKKYANSAKITRFKGLGEMNPQQLKESVMLPDKRLILQLTVDAKNHSDEILDMLLAKKRAPDRRTWLEQKGDLASDLR